MKLDGAFRVLLIPLLLIVDGSPEIVLPPTNLTLSCDNFDVTASWKYKQPNTRFRVQIKDDPRSYETTNHHFDLSPSIWESEEHYLGVHYVYITAILGEKQSSSVLSESLAYNDLKTTNIKCKLDFPPVDLKVVNGEGTVSFINPQNFYKYLQQARKSDTAVFEYNILTEDGRDIKGECKVEDCRQKISFPDDEFQCVTLTGEFCAQPGFRCVKFNETGPICPDVSTDHLWILFGVLLSVVFVIIVVLTILICLTKSWTLKMEKTSLPKPLVQPPTNHRKLYFTPDENDYSAVTLIDKKPYKSSSAEEEDLLESREGSGAEVIYGCYKGGEVLENSNQELEPGYNSTDDGSTNNSLESVVLDLEVDRGEEQELDENGDLEDGEIQERSPYDCPHSHMF